MRTIRTTATTATLLMGDIAAIYETHALTEAEQAAVADLLQQIEPNGRRFSQAQRTRIATATADVLTLIMERSFHGET